MRLPSDLGPDERESANLPVGLGAVVNGTGVVSGDLGGRAPVAFSLFVRDVERDSEGVLVRALVALPKEKGQAGGSTYF